MTYAIEDTAWMYKSTNVRLEWNKRHSPTVFQSSSFQARMDVAWIDYETIYCCYCTANWYET